MTTVLFAGLCMCACVWRGRRGREEEWQRDMETQTLLFSAADRVSRWVHSGESSGNGCKMHNSIVTEVHVALLRKETKKEKGWETGRSEERLRKRRGRKSKRRKKAGGRV